MPQCCAALRCLSRGNIEGITYHCFPSRDADLRKKWIDAVDRKGWEPSKHSRLCSLHFREEDIDRTSLCNVRIREGRIPLIFATSSPQDEGDEQDEEVDLDSLVPECELRDEVQDQAVFIKTEPPECSDLIQNGSIAATTCSDVHMENVKVENLEPMECFQNSEPQETDGGCTCAEKGCERCSEKAKTQSTGFPTDFNQLARLVDGHKTYFCPLCNYQTRKLELMRRHSAMHAKQNVYVCGVCSYRTGSAEIYKRHTAKHSEERLFKCSVCTFGFNTEVRLRKHMYGHTKENPYPCGECEQSFKRAGELKDHMDTHAKDKPYKCSKCPFRSSLVSNLNRHMRVHAEAEAPFWCAKCSQDCADADGLRAHQCASAPAPAPAADESKRFKCPECPYSGKFAYTLSKHIAQRHAGEKPFRCEVCEQRFGRASHLRNHMVTHSQEKPFACDQCDYRCSMNGNLKIHMASHANDNPERSKPYACHLCKFRSVNSGNLKAHLMTHAGRKDFECGECGQRTSRKSALETHIQRKHGGGKKPFPCDLCDYGTFTRQDLKRHMGKVHKVSADGTVTSSAPSSEKTKAQRPLWIGHMAEPETPPGQDDA